MNNVYFFKAHLVDFFIITAYGNAYDQYFILEKLHYNFYCICSSRSSLPSHMHSYSIHNVVLLSITLSIHLSNIYGSISSSHLYIFYNMFFYSSSYDFSILLFHIHPITFLSSLLLIPQRDSTHSFRSFQRFCAHSPLHLLLIPQHVFHFHSDFLTHNSRLRSCFIICTQIHFTM